MNTMPHYVTTLLLYALCLLSWSARAGTEPSLISTQLTQAVCRGEVASFPLQLTSGFRQTYTLRTEGLPGEAVANFSQNTLFPGGSSSLRIQTNGLAAGSYLFRVVAQAGGAQLRLDLELLVATGTPAIPTLGSPTTGATNVFPNPLLSWTTSAQTPGTTYEVELSTTANFSNVIERTTTSALSYVARQASNGYTTYYWRVRALSACGVSSFSTAGTFTTSNVSCQRYSNNTPIDISEFGTSTVGRNIFVGEAELIAEIAVEMDVDHPYLGDLAAVLLSPNGSTFQIFDQPGQPTRDFGCDQPGLYARWMDRASQSASTFENSCQDSRSTIITGTSIYRPQQSFADLRNQNSRGNWTLQLTDQTAGDGGRLQSWSLEVCYQVASAPPQVLVNETLPVPRGDEATITTAYLQASHAGSDADNLLFTLTDLPAEGQLWRDNQALALNAQFTQADINAGRMRYVHSGGIVLNDAFEFTITGANGQSLAGNIFNIEIQLATLSTRLEQLASIQCAGEQTGALRVIVSGGLPPYDYSLNGAPYQDSNIFEELAAGDYEVRVLDALGQTAVSSTFTISTPPPLTATLDLDGRQLTILAEGGTPPYTYRLNNGTAQQDPTFENLPNGDYIVEVRDANDCVFGTTISVAVNSLRISAAIAQPIGCAGSNDGVITAIATDGTAPYEYRLNDTGPFQPSSTFFNLPPGEYQVTVRDQEGFIRSSNTVVLNDPPVLRINANVSGFLITGLASGGTPPYSYSLSPDASTQDDNTFTVTANGAYVVTVRDSRNCLTSTSVNVSVNTLEVSTQLISRPSCAMSSNGVLQLNVNGGTPPFSYRINGGDYQTSNRFSALAAGVYTLSVRDAEGFARSAPAFNLTAPAPLSLAVEVADNRLTAQAGGGTPPYRYRLIGEGSLQESPVFENLPNGTYSLLLTDANGCTETRSATVLINTLQVESELLNGISCPGAADASIQLHVIGGRMPFSYQVNEGPWQDSPVFNPLGPGNYVLGVRDADGFTRTDTTTLILADPEPLNVTTEVDSNSIRVNVSGGTPPYLYSLDDLLYQPGPIFRDLADANHTIYVKDANDCQLAVSALVAYQPLELNVLLLDSLQCANDENARIGIAVQSSFRPYAYRLNTEEYQSDSLFSSLTAGTYTIGVRDGIGRDKEIQWTLAAPPLLTLSANVDVRTITAFADGGTPPYRYRLNGAAWQTSRQFTELPNGEYWLEVEDAEGCVQETLVSILVNSHQIVAESWEIIAYPNPSNGFLTVELPAALKGAAGELRILDLYGRLAQQLSYPRLPAELGLDLLELPASVYLIELRARGQVAWVKIVLE